MRILLLASLVLTAVAADPIPVTVRIGGEAWTVGDQTEVPRGLFGVHAVALTPELIADLGIEASRDIHFVVGASSRYVKGGAVAEPFRALPVLIDCQGDRFYEPLILLRKDWAEALEKFGRDYGALWKAVPGDRQPVVQFWNEAYLNWAERSADARGSTIRQEYYDLTKATEGGPVHLKTTGEPLRHFRWRSLWPTRYVEEKDRKGKLERKRVIGWNIPLPEGATEGTVFTAAETRYWRKPGEPVEWTVERHWFPVDPTAVDFWSGRQNLDFYSRMFARWAAALRAENPRVTILAGWDYNYDAGGWKVWTELYRPLLEQHAALIDGLTEHHYGIPVHRIPAWYEVGSHDAWAIAGKRLRHWNTEAQGRLDPAVHGKAANASGGDGSVAQKRLEAEYNLGDIIGLIARVPEKAASRTAHNFAGNGFADCGAAWALRLLKPLRGRLLRVETSDAGCWSSAALRDGTVVIALANGRPTPLAVSVDLGGVVSGPARITRLVEQGTTLAIDDQALPVQAGTAVITLAPNGVAVVQAKAADGVPRAIWRQTQWYPSEPALRAAAAGAAITATIEIPAEALKGAAAARVRVVIDGDAAPATLTASVNGTTCTIQRDAGITDTTIPLAALQAGRNAVVLTGDAPFLLASCSLIVEGPGPDR